MPPLEHTSRRPAPPARNRWLVALVDYAGMLAVLLLLIGFFSLTTRSFGTPGNFAAIANQVPESIVIAVGMTFVLITAGIDLSVGSVLALSAGVLGVCMARWNWPLAAALPAGLLVGLLCGALNGLTTIAWRLPSFIVTLGMLEIARGATYGVTASQTQYIGSAISSLSDSRVLGLSPPFLLALLTVVAGQLVLSFTVFGRYAVALGTNEEALRLSGVRTWPVRLAVFCTSGALAALAGAFQASRIASADPNFGTGAELRAIAAVVVGGTSLMGGRGSVVRSFLGVFIIAVLEAGLSSLGAKDWLKHVSTGLVIVAAVILDYYRDKLGGRR